MSTVGTVSETVDSVIPSIGDASEPEPTAYKCRRCGRDVEDEVGACPHCSSPNLRPLYL